VKITDVTVRRYSVSRDPRDYMGDIQIVAVHTDAGVSGMGFVTAGRATSDIAATLVRRALRGAVLGENPLLTDDLWRRMYDAVPRRGSEGIVRMCMAGVDFALWDLKGKLLDAPGRGDRAREASARPSGRTSS
jgi:L-rhamnonate dehydratase